MFGWIEAAAILARRKGRADLPVHLFIAAVYTVAAVAAVCGLVSWAGAAW
jgi:hypothetical protein